jgi:signal transduction histidine kinase
LAIAQWIAQAHHGQIRVESVVGKGSTFEVILPAKNHDD